MKEKILISACLLGDAVRYDAGHCLIESALLTRWQGEGRLVALCPEMAAGLPSPRPPCEREGSTGHIIDVAGKNYSAQFQKGAEIALGLVKQHAIRFALLKEQSPSCGVHIVYDGTFTSSKIPGSGVSATALRKAGVQVFSEFELDKLSACLDRATDLSSYD